MIEVRVLRSLQKVVTAQIRARQLTEAQARLVFETLYELAPRLPLITQLRAAAKWRELLGSHAFAVALDSFRQLLAVKPGIVSPDAWAPMQTGRVTPSYAQLRSVRDLGLLGGDGGGGPPPQFWNDDQEKIECPVPEIAVEDFPRGLKRDPGALVVQSKERKKHWKGVVQKIELKWVNPGGVFSETFPVLRVTKHEKIRLFTINRDGSFGGELRLVNGSKSFKPRELNTPKRLYVVGFLASEAMKDIELRLVIENPPPTVKCQADTAVFTCLWVQKPTIRHKGKMDPNAPAAVRDHVANTRISKNVSVPTRISVAGDRELDWAFFEHIYKSKFKGDRRGSRLGPLVEIKALVSPKNFDPARWSAAALKQETDILDQQALGLQRDVAFRFEQQRPKEVFELMQSDGGTALLPWPARDKTKSGQLANDTAREAALRSMKPSADGFIFDYDAPGVPGGDIVVKHAPGEKLLAPDQPRNGVYEAGRVPSGTKRVDAARFKSFCAVILHGQSIRCSPIREWVVKVAVQKYGADDGNKFSRFEWQFIKTFNNTNLVLDGATEIPNDWYKHLK